MKFRSLIIIPILIIIMGGLYYQKMDEDQIKSATTYQDIRLKLVPKEFSNIMVGYGRDQSWFPSITFDGIPLSEQDQKYGALEIKLFKNDISNALKEEPKIQLGVCPSMEIKVRVRIFQGKILDANWPKPFPINWTKCP
jgi:hypothetical protein